MKAVQIEEFGGPEVLKMADVEEPSPNEDEVKIKLYAVGLNPSESYTISGNYAYNVPDLPYIPGYDGAGIIEEVGRNVEKFSKGDPVYLSAFNAERNTGTYAEKVVVETKNVYPLPKDYSMVKAAGLGIPSFTAYLAIHQKAQVRAGERVLVHGGSGAVGTLAIQIAKAAGAVVIGTSSTEEGRQSILDIGADYAINHLSEENTDELMQITDDQGPDVIIEFLANQNLEMDSKVIADYGRIIIVGSRGTIEFTPRNLMSNDAVITGMAATSLGKQVIHEMVHGVEALIETGVINPKIGKIFSLEEASAAHKHLMESSGDGRTVLEIIKEK